MVFLQTHLYLGIFLTKEKSISFSLHPLLILVCLSISLHVGAAGSSITLIALLFSWKPLTAFHEQIQILSPPLSDTIKARESIPSTPLRVLGTFMKQLRNFGNQLQGSSDIYQRLPGEERLSLKRLGEP